MKTLELDIEPRVGGELFRYYPSNVSLTTERIGTPACLTCEIPISQGAVPEMGATVRLVVDSKLVFYGFVFEATIDRWGVVQLTAYDQLRYLRGNYTSYFKSGAEPRDLIKECANFYQLKVGELAETGYKARRFVVEDECCLDAIQKQLDLAQIVTRKIWNFYDDCGLLTLKSADNMITDVLLSDDGFCTDFSLTTDINNDSYNAVALYRPTSDSRGRCTKHAKNEESMSKWGALWLCESVDEHTNSAYMQDKADALLLMKNRPLRSLSISALGVVGLRAGMMVTLNFPSLPGVSKRQIVILDSVTHNFEDGVHTMELSTKTLWEDTPDE